jgi:hypothetical protein
MVRCSILLITYSPPESSHSTTLHLKLSPAGHREALSCSISLILKMFPKAIRGVLLNRVVSSHETLD